MVMSSIFAALVNNRMVTEYARRGEKIRKQREQEVPEEVSNPRTESAAYPSRNEKAC